MNKLKLYLSILVSLLSINTHSFEKNEYFDSYEELETFFFRHSDTGASNMWNGVTINHDEDTNYWSIDISCMCRLFWSSAVLYDWENQKILKVKNEIAGVKHPRYTTTSDNEPWDTPIYKSKEQYEKANIAIRGIIQKVIIDDFDNLYKSALSMFKKGELISAGKRSQYILKRKYMQVHPIQKVNVIKYNDFGYFLEQAGLYEKAINILSKVVSSFPNRTVAYINLGDAYFGMNKIEESKEAYNKYVTLMKKLGNKSRIPSYIQERLK